MPPPLSNTTHNTRIHIHTVYNRCGPPFLLRLYIRLPFSPLAAAFRMPHTTLSKQSHVTRFSQSPRKPGGASRASPYSNFINNHFPFPPNHVQSNGLVSFYVTLDTNAFHFMCYLHCLGRNASGRSITICVPKKGKGTAHPAHRTFSVKLTHLHRLCTKHSHTRHHIYHAKQIRRTHGTTAAPAAFAAPWEKKNDNEARNGNENIVDLPARHTGVMWIL